MAISNRLAKGRGGFEPPFPKQGEGGYDQSWYPIMLSSQLEKGQVVSREFLSGRIIVFRGENGKAVVQSAYCSHFGADLATGTVIGNEIQCPFHHWQYGQDGICTKIPTGDPIPKAARQFVFPTEEKLGVIWAFNGDEPLFELPTLGVSEETHTIRVKQLRNQPHDPSVFMCNALDLQHIRSVHGICFENDKEPEATFNAFEVFYHVNGTVPQGYSISCRFAIYGSSILGCQDLFYDREVKAIYTGAPLPNGHSTSYMITVMPKKENDEVDDGAEQFLDDVAVARENVITEDWPILSRIGHPRCKLFTKSDRLLARFITYLNEYPRAHPSGLYIT